MPGGLGDRAGADGARRRLLAYAGVFSVAAHVAAVVAAILVAMWRVDKLPIEPPDLSLAPGIGAPLPAATTGQRSAAVDPERPRKRLRTVRDRVQPEEKQLRQDERSSPQPGRQDGQPAPTGGQGLKLLGHCPSSGECMPGGLASILAQPVCGDGRIQQGEQCDDGNRRPADGCSALCARELVSAVHPETMEAYRIAGDPQIHAPEAVRGQMAERNQTRAIGTVRMCLDHQGKVASLAVRRSTGFAEYDQLLLGRMRGWRYRPYRLADGTPALACTVVTFIYQAEIRYAEERPQLR